jgi:hypothetical protein
VSRAVFSREKFAARRSARFPPILYFAGIYQEAYRRTRHSHYVERIHQLDEAFQVDRSRFRARDATQFTARELTLVHSKLLAFASHFDG